MTRARVIIDATLLLNDERYTAYIKVFEVSKSFRFPDGYKVRCALVSRATGTLLVLVDNHEPYGYHMHSRLPGDKNFRLPVSVKNYHGAIGLFFKEVRKVLNEK